MHLWPTGPCWAAFSNGQGGGWGSRAKAVPRFASSEGRGPKATPRQRHALEVLETSIRRHKVSLKPSDLNPKCAKRSFLAFLPTMDLEIGPHCDLLQVDAQVHTIGDLGQAAG